MGEDSKGGEWEWAIREMKKISGFWEGGDPSEGLRGKLWRWGGLKVISNGLELCQAVRLLYTVG
jgi:hypothetical protein